MEGRGLLLLNFKNCASFFMVKKRPFWPLQTLTKITNEDCVITLVFVLRRVIIALHLRKRGKRNIFGNRIILDMKKLFVRLGILT